ncbi:ATP-binding cassette domain-containing protein [Oceanobacter mangrovi]|uniref:ATP-binding cassette domain-containing protein n=1 Tax=Oceanobacter mangrovi TaxID=2862510 RepID=UPI001C8DE9C0|nr:ATP-binding cassette domain-containing protein [Oceanobacter mangrovi]
MALFSLQQQSLGYAGRIVLRDISLTIRAGEKIALVGPSGAGKSTLLHHLHQLQPDQIALCPQADGLVELLSAYHNIFMGGLDRVSPLAAMWNLIRPLAQARQQVAQVARQLGIEAQLWQSVDRLSGGQRQRVALGRALYRQQAIFLGDEPVSALDPLQGKLLLESVLSQHQTAVVCMHNPELTLALFDRVIAVANGGILFDRPASELSQHDFDALYQGGSMTDEHASNQPTADQGLPTSCISPAQPGFNQSNREQ